MKSLLTIVAQTFLITQTTNPTTQPITKSLEEIVTTTQATQPTQLPKRLASIVAEWKPKDITDLILKQSKPRFYFDTRFDDTNCLNNDSNFLIRRSSRLIWESKKIGNYALFD